jgi:hypothetical protein
VNDDQLKMIAASVRDENPLLRLQNENAAERRFWD